MGAHYYIPHTDAPLKPMSLEFQVWAALNVALVFYARILTRVLRVLQPEFKATGVHPTPADLSKPLLIKMLGLFVGISFLSSCVLI
jgi:hypothetical protein